MQQSRRPQRGSKYRPLADFLARRRRANVRVTFTEIEEILGFPLPDNPQVDSSWWRTTNAAHVRMWQANGWEARLLVRERAVIFTRIVPHEG
jgi:hypothetical protein